MRTMQKAICTLIFLYLISGCERTEISNPSNNQNDELKAIQAEIQNLKSELETIKQKQAEHEFDKLVNEFDQVAYLRPGDTGYSTIRYDLGVLTVQLVDIQPYANGSKVRLNFGNPLSSKVNGLKAKIEWGKTDENGTPINNSAKSKEVTFNEALRSGAWTETSLVLDDVPPTDLGFVRVKDVSHSGISLSK